MSAAVVEKDKLGGVCVNIGCIPTKALLQSALIANMVKHQAKHEKSSPYFSGFAVFRAAIMISRLVVFARCARGARGAQRDRVLGRTRRLHRVARGSDAL